MPDVSNTTFDTKTNILFSCYPVSVVLLVFVAFFPSIDLHYLIRSIFLFLTTISSVAFIVVPKMYYVRRKALTGELPPGLQRGGVKITGLKAPGTSSGSGSSSG